MSKPPAERTPARIRVTSPCPMRWEALEPVTGGRHCATCQKTVIDVERLTTAELDALVASGERACVRLATLPDGSVLTRDHPRAPRRAAAWAGAALAASTFACSEGGVDEEGLACDGARAPAAPSSEVAGIESSSASQPFQASSPAVPPEQATVVMTVGGLEPMLHGEFETPPMPVLDLTRPLAESGDPSGGETYVLGSIGETISLFDAPILPPFVPELD